MNNVTLQNLFQLEFKDAAITVEKDSKGKPRALLVDMEVSASGRVTNSRIYPPKGHQAGINSWVQPYEKPVQLHHDDMKDPIGRFVKAVWQDNEKEALHFLNGDYKALAAIKKAFETGDAKVIKKTMKQYGALDKKWPGLGKVIGTVRITDEDAIQKFADKRYLTWSAGQSTDAFICMSCNSDWRQGDICEHQMGGVDDKGEPVIFLCGTMTGEEISVVNRPGNDRSITLSMKFEDSDQGDIVTNISISDQLDSAPVVVPTVTVEKEMNLQDLQALEISTVLSLLQDDAHSIEFINALKSSDEFDSNWLVQVHDALHDQWDYQLKYSDKDASRMPESVYKLHAAMHDLSNEKGFRDAMLNGALDGYDNAGGKSEEYMTETEDSDMKGKSLILTDEQLGALTLQVVSALQAAGGIAPKVDTQEATNGESKSEGSEVTSGTTVGSNDATDNTSTEAAGTVPDSTSAEELKPDGASDSTTETPEASTSSNAEGTSPSTTSDNQTQQVDWSAVGIALGALVAGKAPVSKDSNFEELQRDYAVALKQIEELSDSLQKSLFALRKNHEPNADIDDIKLDALVEWFATLNPVNTEVEDSTTEPVVERQLKPTENPNLVEMKDQQTSQEGLTAYEKKAVTRYNTLLKSKNGGKEIADRYLGTVKEFCSKSFDIQKHITD